MGRYIAFLRGINVSGQKIIKMEYLRELFEGMGFRGAKTFIQSGNVVFETTAKDIPALRRKIEQSLEKSLGYAVPVILRSREALEAIVRNNPFPANTGNGSTKTYVTFMADIPEAALQQAFMTYASELEKYHIHAGELYAHCRKDTDAKLLFSNNFVEKKLKITGTTRDMNMLQKLLLLAAE